MRHFRHWAIIGSILLFTCFQSNVVQANQPFCFPPDGLECKQISPNSVLLSWNPVPGAISYEIDLIVNDPECCGDAGAPYGIMLVPVTTNSATVSLLSYPCFSWRVRAVCQEGEGGHTDFSRKSCSCGHPPELPCSTFDGSNPLGNWGPAPSPNGNVGVGTSDINALDGSNCLTLTDQSGSSWFENTVDFNNLAQNYLHKCLCFDFALGYVAPYGGLPYHPTIYLSDGVNSIAFVANVALNPYSNWVTVCAPIEHCVGSTLPGNADGNWVYATPGMTCADFNNVIDNVTSIALTPDVNSNPSEVMYFDNICVRDCNGCNSNFTLQTAIHTASGTADAAVVLDNANPNATYVVDWGDGSSGTPGTPHTYTSQGNYQVCVTEIMEDGTTCRTCVTFCFNEIYQSEAGQAQRMNADPKVITVEDVNVIGRTELSAPQGAGYIVSPNPAKDYIDIYIKRTGENKYMISLMDLMGNIIVVNQGALSKGGEQIRMDTKEVPSGIYMLKVKMDDKESVSRISIVK